MFAAIAARRLPFVVCIAGLLALASAAHAAPSTGGVTADPAATQTGTVVALPGPGAVQAALHIPVTHRWDHRTRGAVRDFQRRHHLTVDGIVGPQTAGALGLTASATDASSTPVSTELAKIAACESDDDPQAISKDGQYRGKYQFTRATWASMGGSGDPAKASEAVQDRMAAKLLAVAGPSAWPTCG